MIRLPALCLLVVFLQSIPLAIAREARVNKARHLFARGQAGNGSDEVETVTHTVSTTTTDCPQSSITAAANLSASTTT